MQKTIDKDSRKQARQDKQREFFRVVFKDQIDDSGMFIEEQHLRLFKANADYTKVEFFRNIAEVVEHINSKTYGMNTYFNLSLTNGLTGQEQDLKTRSVLAWDFDKKDLPEGFSFRDVIDRFKSVGLWYHTILDSGNGYHAYTCIQPTQDHKKVVEVIQAIGNKLGADKNAMKSTQVLRVPYTFNVKDPSQHKQVRIIKQFDIDTIKPYDLDQLYKRHCCNERDKQGQGQEQGTGDRVTIRTVNSTNIPQCIQRVLLEGSKEGARYDDLQRIVVTLRSRNKSLTEIKALCKEWAEKSEYRDNVDYRTEHIYNNLEYVSLNCTGCKIGANCYDKQESEFQFPEGYTLIEMNEKQMGKLKPSKRKGSKVMEGNDLLIYGILKNHSDGLFRDEIIKELTYKKECRFSDKTLTKALQSLEQNEFIEVSGKPKFYKIKDTKHKIELTYNISYGATYEAIKGHISTEELRLYNYMRYLHHKQQREDSKALKGNLFQFRQTDLAKELGVTQARISQMINNLIDEKLLSIWYREQSKNNCYDYYVYRLNY